MDPIVTNDETVLELKNFLLETLREANIDFSIHDFRTVIGTTHTKLSFDVVLPFESEYTEKDIVEKICTLVHSKREECYCVINVDRN